MDFPDPTSAEQAFYAAFSDLDDDAMQAVWVDSDDASCIHPGGTLLRGTKDILMWMLSTKMLPAAAVLYPMTFLTKNFLNIYDTHFLIILVLCLINLPIVIWMLFTYFKEIPKEIIDAVHSRRGW